MKNTLIAVAGVLSVLSFTIQAEDMPGMNMQDKPKGGMSMPHDAQQAPLARAEGTVKAIDAATSVVTLAHGPVPALHWPAMIMGFQATAEQLKGLRVGDEVSFEFQSQGMAARIVSIQKAD